MKRRIFSRRTFIKTLGVISLPSFDPRLLNSQWLAGAGDRLKILRRFVPDKGKFGLINQSGDFILPPVYDSWLFFTEGLAYVVRDDRKGIRSGYINKSGEVVIKMKSGHHGRSFHDGLAGVQKNDKWGFIDKTGKWSVSQTPLAAW